MDQEIEFQKYKRKGDNYHWKQISRSLRFRNLFVVARYQLVLDLIKEEVKNKRVLDVGCGDGVLSCFFAKRNARVVGIDISGEAIDFARKKCENFDIDFRVGSIYQIPFNNKTFDYIVSSEVIEHIKEPGKMLKEIKRVWNEKGKIIITTPIRYTKTPLDKMHYQEFFKEDFEKILEENFKEYSIEITKSHPLFWVELYNRTLLRKRWFKFFLNVLNLILKINPFKNSRKWKYFSLQVAIISK